MKNSDSEQTTIFKITKSAIKKLQRYHLNENKVVDDLYQSLKNNLEVTPGSKIKILSGYDEDILRQRETDFRLIVNRKKKGKGKEITIIDFFHRKEEYNHVKSIVKNSIHQETYLIKEIHKSSNKALKKFINEDYKYSLEFTPTQKETIENNINIEKPISIILGFPGAGKTLLSAEIIKRINTRDETIMVIVPNNILMDYYYLYLINNGIEPKSIIKFSDEPKLIKGSIIITSFNELTKLFFHQKNVEEELMIIEKDLGTILQHFEPFNSAREILNYYNAFWDADGKEINTEKKDQLIETSQREKIESIRKNKKLLTDKILKKNYYTRNEIAKEFFEKIKTSDENIIHNFISSGNNLLFVVDEVQDLIFEEWRGFIDLAFLSYSDNNTGKVRVLFSGDEKQRITTSGFSWGLVKTHLHNLSDTGQKSYLETELTENFRVPKKIAEFVEFIDSLTDTSKTRGIKSIKKENCKYEGNRVNIVKGNIKNLATAIKHADNDKDQVKNNKVIVISERKPPSDDKILALKTVEAKGTEFESVFLLNPFDNFLEKFNYKKNKFNPEENYILYTMSTRAKSSLTLLLNSKEYSWFKKNADNNSSFVIHPEHKDTPTILKDIIQKVGLEDLSLNKNIQIIIANKITNLFLQNLLHNKEFFIELNEILLLMFHTEQEILSDVINIMNDKITLIETNELDSLNYAIESLNELNKSQVKMIWALYRKEFFKALLISHNDLPQYYHQILKMVQKGKIDPHINILIEQIKAEKDGFQDRYKTDMHEKYYAYMKDRVMNSNISESQLVYKFYNTKIREVINILEEN